MTYYGSESGFRDYFEARGKDVPAEWDADIINAALLVASEWVDDVYGPQFSGYKTGLFVQDREWPRVGATTNTVPKHVFADSDIPDRVKNATYEAAYRQIGTPDILSKDYTPNKYKSVSIDGALSVDYATFNQANDIQNQFIVIDRLLSPLLNQTGIGGISNLSGNTVRV